MNLSDNSFGYLSLCYHYIRSKKADSEFPLILGNSENVFKKHIDTLQKKYQVISPHQVCEFSSKKLDIGLNKTGLLFTFDDGLSEHYLAAKILASRGIKAIFFIPTCILDQLPANPTIIHYCLATAKITGFINQYKITLKYFSLNLGKYQIKFKSGSDDPWSTIAGIKKTFKYKLKSKVARKILIHIYENLLLKNDKKIFEKMHLTHNQIKEMIDMGHSIGSHTYSHISVGSAQLTSVEFKHEIITPKEIIEKTFKTKVTAFSYPFGDKQDCLSTRELITKTDAYKLAFTVETILNTQKTSCLELGRYMPHSLDTTSKLLKILDNIENK